MKKPTKQRIVITERSNYIDWYTSYSPEQLRQIADNMEDNGIKFIELQSDYDDHYVVQGRMETEKEAERRYDKEIKQYKKYQKNRESRKAKLIKEAKALGLELIEKKNSKQYLEQDAIPILPDLSQMGIQKISEI